MTGWPNGWGQLSYKYRGEKVGAVRDAPRLFMMVVRNANKRSRPVLTEVGNFRKVARFDEMQSCIKKKNIERYFATIFCFIQRLSTYDGIYSFNVRTILITIFYHY